MPSILTFAALAILLLFLRYPYRLIQNVYYARRTGLPYLLIPFDQDAFIWVILSVPLRPFLKKHLPAWAWERVGPTIWGWEFHERMGPWERNASQSSDPRTLAFATCGNFEVNSWDPEFAMEILKRPKDFVQPHFNTLFIGRFGHNVLTTNGEKWARQRKIIAQVINERLSESIFNETVKQTTGLLDDVTAGGSKSSVDTLGMFDMMKRLTIHVLSGAGMGQSVPWNTTDSKPMAGRHMTYIESAKVIMDAIAGPIILPTWFLDNYPSFMPGYNYVKRLGYAVHEYPVHTRDMLHEERQRQAQGDGEIKSNIVSQLLQASQGGKHGTGLTEDEMVGNLFVFTAAGFDTTANTLSYALASLAREPRWQEWIFEEIDTIMPQDSSAPVDYASLFPRASRTLAIMLETLRLFTPLVHISKQASQDREHIVRTSKATYRLPPGTQVYVSAIGLHLDPLVWRNINKSAQDNKIVTKEADELLFRPSRWIVQDGDSQSLFRPPTGSYVPWSAGPRNCPGMKMAQVEFVATMLTLFRTYRLTAVPLQVPAQAGQAGLGTREETLAEIEKRMDDRIKDSVSILTLQINGIYDATKPGNEANGIKLRISKRK